MKYGGKIENERQQSWVATKDVRTTRQEDGAQWDEAGFLQELALGLS